MINSLFSQNGYTPAPAFQQAINSQQVDALKNVLSNYNASNISETDAKTIISEVRELGVAPGRPLAIIFAGEGFEAAAIGNKAGAGGKEQAPPLPQERSGPKGEINKEAVAALKLLVDAKQGEDITQSEWADFYSDLEDKGVDTSRPFIDLKL